MQFKLSELPQQQLALLGLTQKDIKTFPPRTVNALLSGNRTSLIRFEKLNIPGMSSLLSLDAKLSLERKPDNSVSIKIHPINLSAKNTFNLTKEELQDLTAGKTNFISKQLKDAAGKSSDHLVTLDKTTNEFIAVKKDKIVAPEIINSNALTAKQKADFKNGKDVKVGDETYKLDPSDELGIKEKNGKPLKNVRMRHSAYSENDLLIDVALLVSGLGHFVLLEHLAILGLQSGVATLKAWQQTNHLNKAQRDALAKASPALTAAFKQTQQLSAKEIQALVEHHLGETIASNNQMGAIRRQYTANNLPQNFDQLTTKELNSLSIDIRDSYESKGYLTSEQQAANSIIDQKLSGEKTAPFVEDHLKETNELNKSDEVDSNLLKEESRKVIQVKI